MTVVSKDVGEVGADYDQLRWVYRKMLEIRFFEEAACETFHQRLWKGSLHACIGQEAIAAAMGAVLKPTDYLVSSHRGHGHILAKGVSPKELMAELFGRTTGVCGGRGGSMHAMDPHLRVYPQGLVGSGAYLAAGIGLGIKMRKGSEVVVSSFGDGAINTGGCHEGLNVAAVHKVPAVFVCENNKIAVSTPIDRVLPVASITDRASAYGMPGKSVNGTDAVAMLEALKECVRHARDGKGPSMLEAACFRWQGHTAWDPSAYRTSQENEEWQLHDPIPRLEKYLNKQGALTPDETKTWNEEYQELIHEAVSFSKDSPEPELSRDDILKFVYVEENDA
jgi:TPP-dependent pyruvate/acetoin dehydrogenase alpha subunit